MLVPLAGVPLGLVEWSAAQFGLGLLFWPVLLVLLVVRMAVEDIGLGDPRALPLALEACTECHDSGGDRAPLFKVHAHPIRVLVDYGYMPVKHRLTPEELAELKAWLEAKP